jgi:2-haloacid dehalogenase
MTATLAFDVYGTLIDTHGVVARLAEIVGDRAGDFSRAWRDKQLEYSFRRGLMQNYVDFSVCTEQALDYISSVYRVALTDERRTELLESYRALPAFDDVREALPRLESAGYRMYAFSNGAADAVEALLTTAGIRNFFRGVVSCEDLKSFKPNPAVYAHFLRQAGATGAEAWLVSGNPFDVIGAISAGMHGAWVKRSPEAIFDPWGIEPTVTVARLSELADAIGERRKKL